MNEEPKISCINQRGRIVLVRQQDLKRELARGLRIFPNPKEIYYPNFDSEYNKQAAEVLIPGEKLEGKLEVVVL